MLTIGTFARLGAVSVRALRHYATVGVLTPSWIDPATGYRYYRAVQLAALHRIQALQDLGLSLQQIRPLLDDGVSPAQLSGMLALKRAELAAEVAEGKARLRRVEQRLRYIELEDHMSIDFVLKEIPAVRVAQVRHRGEEGLDFYGLSEFSRPAARTLRDALRAAEVKPVGPGFLHYEPRPDDTLTPIAAIPIGPDDRVETAEVETVGLPAITAVVTYVPGAVGHDLIGPIYGQMAQYAEDHGYTVAGPGRDCLISDDDADGGRLLELQLPVVPVPHGT